VNEPDFSAFAALWQQEPAEEEVRIFRKLARRASRRAHLLRHAETWFGYALAAATLATFLLAPGLLTGALAFLLAAVTAWTAWQRHRFDLAAADLSRNDRQVLLESSERSARAALRKSTVGTVTAFPGGMALLALLDLVKHGGETEVWLANLPRTLGSTSVLVSIALVTLVTLGGWRQNRRLRRELHRIEALRRAYREEDLLDRAAASQR
jgi:hypothetical protein